jgi:hypothetical protein
VLAHELPAITLVCSQCRRAVFGRCGFEVRTGCGCGRTLIVSTYSECRHLGREHSSQDALRTLEHAARSAVVVVLVIVVVVIVGDVDVYVGVVCFAGVQKRRLNDASASSLSACQVI